MSTQPEPVAAHEYFTACPWALTDPYIPEIHDTAEDDAADAAEESNTSHPIGTPVMAYPGTRGAAPLYTHTRSAAWTLGHGAAVVLVEGYTGGIALTHVDAAPDGWELTPRNYIGIESALDRDGVFTKAYTRYVDGVLATVGLRIGEKPNHVIAYFGDTIVRRADRTYIVRRAEEMRRLAVQRHAIDTDGMERFFAAYAETHPEWCGTAVKR